MPANSQETSCQEWVAALKARQGRVETQQDKQIFWLTAELEDTYCFGDRLRTFQRSRATVLLRDKSYLRLNQNTITRFPKYKNEEALSLINLIKGAIFFRSRVPHRLEIETPFVNAVIKGTEFLVVVEENQTQVTVFEGVVETSNKYGQLTLGKGETAIAKLNQPPQHHILVKPDNAVQWALYYPPVIDFRTPESYPAASNFKSVLDAYQQGDLPTAFDVLDSIPKEQHNNAYFILKSALLLTVGRVDEAQPHIALVLAKNPNNVNALSLQSIIAITHNDNEEAIALARQAVKTDPHSAPALIALSYAQQAGFELKAARASLEKAVELAPNDALAWARLAELQLSFGDLDDALEAAEKAVSLNPNLERTQSVLGFAALTRIDIDKAKAAFNKAIHFNPAAPLARLGLGLAKIRQGDLDEGTEEMEIAASLDPNNSLIRSYLGKAFYEKKDKYWASKELAIAKQLDPKDPTPWFYDAILKQTTNRPVEALHDMHKAIALNDNRAVYRSRLLLDDDLAGRNVSQSRIYSDLSFEQLALVEGWKSVNTDIGNYSAHRLIADSYSKLRRHDIARVSELLQSQLLQPLNVTAIQPQLAEINLPILEGTGPAEVAFNEFNPLFIRNRLAFQASGLLGSHDTYGNEVVHSGMWDNFSYSLGQFYYDTDGFRDNSDLKHEIYTAFGQARLSKNLSIQAEIRRKITKSGDLRLHFEGSNVLDPNKRTKATINQARIGLHKKLNKTNEIIASYIYVDRDTHKVNSTRRGIREKTINVNAHTAEVGYLIHTKKIDSIFGGGFSSQYRTDTVIGNNPVNRDSQHWNAFSYTNIKLLNNLTSTLGISFDAFNRKDLDSNQVNPKFGITWQPIQFTTLRLAWFKGLKRPFVSGQTIEPTQVGGFIQYFDDIDATRYTRYGVALDQVFSSRFFGGFSLSRRRLKIPVIIRRGLEFRKQKEDIHSAYLYWTTTSKLAFSLDYFFERINNPFNNLNQTEITTHRSPISISYFLNNGLKTKLTGSFITQKVHDPVTPQRGGNDNFWIVDMSASYRLPQRLGIISAGVKNILDQTFKFQDINVVSNEALNPIFQPSRQYFCKITTSF